MRASEDGQSAFAHASGENDEAARKEDRILETVHPTHRHGTIYNSLKETPRQKILIRGERQYYKEGWHFLRENCMGGKP